MGHEVRAGHHEPGYNNSRARTREKEGPLLRVWRRARRSEARRGTTDVTVDGGALHSAADEACEGPEGGAMARTRVGGRPWERRLLQEALKSHVGLSLKGSSDMSSVCAASAGTAEGQGSFARSARGRSSVPLGAFLSSSPALDGCELGCE